MNAQSEGLYAVPKREDWPVYSRGKWYSWEGARKEHLNPKDLVSMLDLNKEEVESLRLVRIFADLKSERGKQGSAPVANLKKVSVVRAEYVRADPGKGTFPTPRAKAAFEYLCETNATYENWRGFLADRLLLNHREKHNYG